MRDPVVLGPEEVPLVFGNSHVYIYIHKYIYIYRCVYMYIYIWCSVDQPPAPMVEGLGFKAYGFRVLGFRV